MPVHTGNGVGEKGWTRRGVWERPDRGDYPGKEQLPHPSQKATPWCSESPKQGNAKKHLLDSRIQNIFPLKDFGRKTLKIMLSQFIRIIRTYCWWSSWGCLVQGQELDTHDPWESLPILWDILWFYPYLYSFTLNYWIIFLLYNNSDFILLLFTYVG